MGFLQYDHLAEYYIQVTVLATSYVYGASLLTTQEGRKASADHML
jgi:hypothetical protein